MNSKLTLVILCSLISLQPILAQQNLPGTTTSPLQLSVESRAGKSSALPNAPTPQIAHDDPRVPGSSIQLRLSLTDAENLALRNNPTISVAHLSALASHQVIREAKSNLWPTAYASLTAVDAHDDSRIAAGALNNPIIFERAAAGTTVSQLITDFGHTSNLIASARLQAKAEDQNAIATRAQVLLAIDQAFYNALQAQALLKVAEQTVTSRQLVSDQVLALAKSKLKSNLDLSFANVNLSQATLLKLDAENNAQAALASLSAVLGYPNPQNIELVEETKPVNPPVDNPDNLIAEAFSNRPELRALDFQAQSEQKLRNANRDQLLPTISALGTIGDTPVGDGRLSSWYGAVGVNVQIPIFNGFLFNAKTHEADLRAQATTQRVLDLRNRISRDVRSAWLNARTNYERLSVSAQLLDQANQALDLSQTRYKLGLGSIVELSQAQLQQTQAQIGNTQAGYEYRLALSALRFQTGGAVVTAMLVPTPPSASSARTMPFKTRVKVDSVPAEYTPTTMTALLPVSMQDFHFDVEPETLSVRIVVDYTYPNENMLGTDDSKGGPPQTTMQISGLQYDPNSRAIFYTSHGKQTVCANVEESRGILGKHTKVRNTGFCTVTAEDGKHSEDDGWRVHRSRTLDTYFEVL